ncbi:MAG: hypothetical protein ACQEXQ_21995 [Bacillota bacterium]
MTLFRVAPEGRKLANLMHRAWIAFAHHGNPNTEGLQDWPAFDLDDRAVMVFDVESKEDYDPYEDREIWEQVFARS